MQNLSPQYDISTLDNKVKLITYKMPYFKSIAINIIVNAGSRNETLQENGLSHFLEHMAFKGTASRTAKQIAEQFDQIGGYFNAYTSREQTVFHAKVLSEYTEQAIEILSDIIQHSLYNFADIAKEKNVIAQEIAQNNDSPEDVVYDNLLEISFKDQAIGRSILGSVKSISEFNKAMLDDFIAKYYTTDNMVISMAGDLEHAEVVRLTNNLFNRNYAEQHQQITKAKYTAGYSCVEKDLEQLNMLIAYETVSYIDTLQYYQAQLLSVILGGGFSSRLFQEIREQRGLVYSVGSYVSSYADTGLFTIHAGLATENFVELLQVIASEIHQTTISITENELVRAKAQVRASLLMADEKPTYKAEEIGKSYLVFKKYFTSEEIFTVIESITIADLLQQAKNIFSRQPNISLIGPKIKKFTYTELQKLLAVEQ